MKKNAGQVRVVHCSPIFVWIEVICKIISLTRNILTKVHLCTIWGPFIFRIDVSASLSVYIFTVSYISKIVLKTVELGMSM